MLIWECDFDVRLVQCCRVDDVTNRRVLSEYALQKSPVSDVADARGAWSGEHIQAEWLVAILLQGEHESGTEMTSGAGH